MTTLHAYVRLGILFTMLAVAGTGIAHAQAPNLVKFYPFADSIIQYPGMEKDLVILRQKQVSGQYVSFVGYGEERKALIAVVTPVPLKDPASSLALIVQFDQIKPSAGRVTTWGYIFDRNSDGKIDYMALLGGAAAVKSGDVEDDSLAMRGAAMSPAQVEKFVGHCALVFNHWADDNYDDTLDALVHIDMDPFRDWVERNIIVRSTRFDGKFDQVWAFREMGEPLSEPVEHTADSVAYYPIGLPPADLTIQNFRERTKILDLINRAAVAAGLKQSDFVRMKEEIQ